MITGRARHLCAIGLALVIVLAACGRTQGASPEPEVPGDARTVDRSPFAMVNPTTTEGPTTIPGVGPTLYLPTTIDPLTGESGVVGELPPSQGGPSVNRDPNAPKFTVPPETTTTARPTTTTSTTSTTLPPYPLLRDVASITSICGFSAAIRSWGVVLTIRGYDVRSFVANASSNTTRYAEVAPPSVRPKMQRVAAVVSAVAASGASVGYDVNQPPFSTAIADVANGRGAFADFLPLVTELRSVELFLCGTA